MAIEQILERLCEAVERNTAALTGGKVPAASAGVPSKGGAEAKGAEGSRITADELRVAAAKVADKHGKPFAKKLIKDVGGAENLPNVKKEKFGALMKAFEKALTPVVEEEDSTDEDDEDL